jgi:hypothetical protein
MSQFIQSEQTKLFNELGVFFAFSNKQFEEQKADDVEYCTVLGAGDCVPKTKAKEFATRLSAIHKEGVEKELNEKGLDTIIEEELANHECFYTGELDGALEALECYGATLEQVKAVYKNVAHKYDNW